MKVRFGQTATGGKTHLIVGDVVTCPSAAWKTLTTVAISDVKPADVCYWCRRESNLAAAYRSNCFGNGWSQGLDLLLADIEPVQTAAQKRALDAQIADERIAFAGSGFSGALYTAPAAVVAPVEPDLLPLIVEPVRSLSRLGDLAIRLGGRPQGAARDHAAARLARIAA